MVKYPTWRIKRGDDLKLQYLSVRYLGRYPKSLLVIGQFLSNVEMPGSTTSAPTAEVKFDG